MKLISESSQFLTNQNKAFGEIRSQIRESGLLFREFISSEHREDAIFSNESYFSSITRNKLKRIQSVLEKKVREMP